MKRTLLQIEIPEDLKKDIQGIVDGNKYDYPTISYFTRKALVEYIRALREQGKIK